MSLLEKIFGDLNKKEVKKVEKIADKVDALEDWAAEFSDEELRGNAGFYQIECDSVATYGQKGSACTLPKTSASSSSANRESETPGFFGINNPTVSDYVGTVDVLRIGFSHLSGHNNTSFLHIASHYFPVAGLLHLTRVQLKSPELQVAPGLLLVKGLSVVAMVSRRKEGCKTHSNALQR